MFKGKTKKKVCEEKGGKSLLMEKIAMKRLYSDLDGYREKKLESQKVRAGEEYFFFREKLRDDPIIVLINEN